jgi:hypothetical protein
MRILLIICLLVTSVAYAQTRVKENIKQQTISAPAEDSGSTETSKPRPSKRKKK